VDNPILVTGAGRRVGFHIASRLKQDGYDVLAHYRTETDDVQKLRHLGIQTIQADLQDTSSIMAFIDQLQQLSQTYRGIVHNASAFIPTADDLNGAAEQYQLFFTVHMLAPFLINQALVSKLKGPGVDPADIIHITDINVENPTPRFDIYGTTKAGLHNLTVVSAKKFAPHIKVNSVAPGPVLFTDAHSHEVRQKMLAETPLGREGGAEPVYLAIKSLLENPFITGATIPVDGGRRLSKA
jgi:dihydromonapterin reductase/dihydrofolate reductase